jgi:APA family basic amino acid/polyamine antiporter
MRKTSPEIQRPFKTPLVPLVPILGALVCLGMIIGLDKQTLLVAAIWMVAGLLIYFLYSKHRSKLRNPSEILPHASDFEKQ